MSPVLPPDKSRSSTSYAAHKQTQHPTCHRFNNLINQRNQQAHTQTCMHAHAHTHAFTPTGHMPTPTAQLNVGLLLLLTSSRVVLTATVFEIVKPMTCHLCTHPTTNLPAPSADHLNTQPQTCHVFTPFTGRGNSHTHGRRQTNKQIRNNS